MSQIVEIDPSTRRLFSLDEARELLPIVRRVTKSAADELDRISIELVNARERERRDELEERVHDLFARWQNKVRRLGAETKGMWVVDFDNGSGYYCWHFPEAHLEFFHGYEEGYRGRVRIQ